jgi:hypothetical protein
MTTNTKKDNRPFYKKKRVLIPAGLLIVGMIGSQMDKDKKTNISSGTNSTTTEQSVATSTEPSIDLKTKITNSIKSIDSGDDLTKNPINSATDFQITVTIFKAYATIIKEGKQSSDKEILRLTNELKKKVIASQMKNFPKIRKAYYEFIKNKLWENDVYVDVSGSGNTNLKFTGAYFAANKNIKTTQETLHEMLTLLRFKQTQYRWYKEQEEYTYYKIETPADNVIEE